MDSAAHYLSKDVYVNICHGKNSKVTEVDKFQKFRVDIPLKGLCTNTCKVGEGLMQKKKYIL